MKVFNGKSETGFTLVEMLVVAPVIIIIIGISIGAIVALTGDVMVARDTNAVEYNLQEALNKIEQDVSLSDGFLATNNIDIQTPQGSDNVTQAFVNNADSSVGRKPSLILNMKATDKNPLRTDRNIIYAKDQPNACASTKVSQNTPVMYNVVYFIKNGSLWRRVIVPSNFTTIGCATPWQQPSCDPVITHANCKSKDSKLLNNVNEDAFSIKYYPTPYSTTENTTPSQANQTNSVRQIALQTTNTVEINIQTDSTTAGRNITRSDKVRATTSNVSIKSLVVTTQPSNITKNSGESATFNVVSARSNTTFQWQQSTDQGSTWTNLSNGGSISGATSSTLTINPATNTMDGNLYRAVLTSGTDKTISNSARLTINESIASPWNEFSPTDYLNSWENYSATYNSGGYRRTAAGVVILKGLIKKSTSPSAGETIARLPVSYRPAKRLVFLTSTWSNTYGRIDIDTDGYIRFQSGSNTWISLEGIHFIPNSGRYTLTPINIFKSGWNNYGGSYETAKYTTTETNRVHMQGMLSVGTTTPGTSVFDLPSSLLPSQYLTFLTSSSTVSAFEIRTSGGFYTKGIGSSYSNLNILYYKSSFSGWSNMTLLNSWVNYGGSSATAQYTKAADGLVTLKGRIKSGAIGSIIATLPVGYRPSLKVLHSGYAINGHARIDIYANGDIQLVSGSGTTDVSLDGLTFYADQ